MALDQDFFDAIQFDVHWKKYYSADQVNALLDDICQQAAALGDENRALTAKLKALTEKGKALVADKRTLTRENKTLADELKALSDENDGLRRRLNAALKKAEQSQAESAQQQEYIVQKVQDSYDRMRQQYISGIEALNADWQEFLCGLQPVEAEAAPADMSEKVSAIASELLAIGGSDDV